MNITLTPSQLSGLAFATAKRNSANPTASPMSEAEFAADLLGVQLDAFEGQRISAARAAMTPIADALIAGSESLRTRVLGYAAAEIAKKQSV